MRQRLVTSDLSIEELLSGSYAFSIPAYQRDYTWTRVEALQLLDDLDAVLDDAGRAGIDTPYFLGTMLFIEPPGEVAGAGARMVEVVDGQQRLITLTILLCVLRDMSADATASGIERLVGAGPGPGEAGDTYHLRLRSSDEEFFRLAIQTRGATRRGQPAAHLGTSIARRNIEEVRRTLRTKLLREMSVSERLRLMQFVLSGVRVLVVSSDDFDYAYQIFLTINDRGKRLSVEDIFRGEILGPLDRDQRRRYDAIIDEMEKYREEAEATRTKGKTFFSHLATIDGWPRRGIIEGLKRAVERRGGPRRFVAEVFAPMAESYLQIKGAPTAAQLPGEVVTWLRALRWLERHGDDDWVPVAMLGIARLQAQPDALVAFLRALDRFSHGLMALGCGREARRKHYAPVLKRLVSEEELPEGAALFSFNAGTQRAILRNIATRLHLIDPPTARLVLARADQALSGRPFAYYDALLDRDRKDPTFITVEHVCPKGELEDGDWLRLFPRKTVRQRAAQCIGNLVLIPDDQNREGSQRSFAEKRALFFPDETPAPFHLTELLRAEAEWDGLAIARRYNLVMSTVREMWGLAGSIPMCPALGHVPAAPVRTSQALGA